MADKDKLKSNLPSGTNRSKNNSPVSAKKSGGQQQRVRLAQHKSENQKISNTPEQLFNNEARYLELADNIREYIFACDLQGKAFYVNKSACEISGYSKEEAIGMNVADVIPGKNLPMMAERLARRRAGDKTVEPYEIEFINKKGQQFLFEISSTLITEEDKPKGVLFFCRDITARRQIEEALKASEKKFREFAELLPGSAFECDLNFKVSYFNKKSLNTYGYSQEDIEAGLDILKTVAPEEIDGLIRSIAGMLDGTFRHPVESIAVRKDGSRFPIHISAATITDNGKPVGIRGLAIDISDLRQKENALRRSEARYRAMIETLEDGYFETDLKGNITNFNESATRIIGWTKEELRGASYKAYCTPEYYERLFLEFNKVFTTWIPAHGIEMAVMKRDGEKHIGEISVSLMRDEKGNPAGFRGTVRDITERKKMEAELLESRERFQKMVGNVPGIIFQWIVLKDGSTNLAYVSDSIKEIGLNVEELKKDPLKVFSFFQKEDKKRLLAGIAAAAKSSGHLNWEGQVTINNVNRWSRCLAYARKQDNGDVIFDGLILDVTENKKAEEEKRELEIRLQQAQKMEAVGTLAGGIAHDFNNLLMGIQGYTSLMLLETDHRHSSYRKLKNIEEMVNSGANLTKQLLGFARRGRYEIKPVNFNDIISKTTALFGRTKKDVFIHRLLEKDLWIVEADQGQIEQMLLNLYVNAWQAMPGGGDLYLETKNVVIVEDQFKQYSAPAGNYIKISITDTGAGMDEATRERIFEPFFTTKEMGRGTGLGLATVYGIVKGHNGVINVYSEKGHGTSFSIYLPATDKELIFEHKSMATLAKGCETILLVDDEDSVIEVTKELLKVLGYKIISVSSGADAIEIFRVKNSEIDLVILDMVMPELSGNKTFDALKAIDPQVKVILSSGYSINGEAAEIMKKGCRAFIQKPFNIGDISQKIRETLEKN